MSRYSTIEIEQNLGPLPIRGPLQFDCDDVRIHEAQYIIEDNCEAGASQ